MLRLSGLFYGILFLSISAFSRVSKRCPVSRNITLEVVQFDPESFLASRGLMTLSYFPNTKNVLI